ncbi:hypothetical protein ACTXT7_008095 [Hymenolepis weldensis]
MGKENYILTSWPTADFDTWTEIKLIIGDLEIRLEYENKLGVQPGWKCDPFHDFCDLYFKICLTQESSSE